MRDGVKLGVPVTLNGSGVAVLTTSTLPHGSWTITADYLSSTVYTSSQGLVHVIVN
jgi:hypothetical protein